MSAFAGDQTSLKETSDEVDKLISGAKKTTVKPEPEPAVDVSTLSDAELLLFLQGQELKKARDRAIRQAKKAHIDENREHKFWNTQPMPALSENPTEGNGPINPEMTVDQVKQDAYNMPAGFEWCNIDIRDEAQALEMYNLLNENYVEDDECQFRFDYSIPFLRWALTVPHSIDDWIVGVRSQKTRALMGCITAIPVHVSVRGSVQPMVEINFLCVHKKLRTKRLAPVLIKEITRRVNLRDRWQAVYTAGVVLPKPISRCRYYHRSINPKKLIEAKFSYLPSKTTMAAHIKNLKLPNTKTNHGLRPLTAADIPSALLLVNNYLQSKTHLAQVFTEEELAHQLLPRAGVVNAYVIQGDDGTVTDICSFYHLPSTIIGNPLHGKLNAVYSYYNVATTVPLVDLMQDLLILARDEGADVFNALDAMDNITFLEQLKFGMGDGYLQYYVYNWRCPSITSQEVGLVLL